VTTQICEEASVSKSLCYLQFSPSTKRGKRQKPWTSPLYGTRVHRGTTRTKTDHTGLRAFFGLARRREKDKRERRTPSDKEERCDRERQRVFGRGGEECDGKLACISQPYGIVINSRYPSPFHHPVPWFYPTVCIPGQRTMSWPNRLFARVSRKGARQNPTKENMSNEERGAGTI